jgi:hypothetical protein
VSDALIAANEPPVEPPALPDDAAATERSSARRRAWINGGVIAVVALLALAILLLQSLSHGHLTGLDEYDDGAYYGSALQLLHGLLPYRDYAFIQPPLVTVWLLPPALLSLHWGTAVSFEAARIFIDLITTANVVLVGLLVRRRPTLQVLVATGATAAFPGTVGASQTVLIEPLLVLACLAGLLCLFTDGRLSRSWLRIAIGGAFFGLAGATKLWAIFPFLAVLLILLPLGLRRWLTLIAGGLVGFAAGTLPFFVGAPNAFIQQVFVTQAIRSGSSAYPLWQRAADLTGLPGLNTLLATTANKHGIFPTPDALSLDVLYAVLALIVATSLLAFVGRRREPLRALDWLALLATACTAAGLLVAPEYYYHYGAFEAPFIGLLYAAIAVRLRDRLLRRRAGVAPAPDGRRSVRRGLLIAAAAAVVAIPLLVIGAMVEVRVDVIEQAAARPQLSVLVGDAIPRRGCVLYTNLSVGILADRDTTFVRGCPTIVDYLGSERALDHGIDQSKSDLHNRVLQAELLRAVEACSGVVTGSNPGWDAVIYRYLHRDFHHVTNKRGQFSVWVRNRRHRARGRPQHGVRV